MAIGLVEADDFDAELKRLNPQRQDKGSHITDSRAVIIDKPSKGRKEGDVNVPDSIRQIIGEEALLNGRDSALQLGKDFGLSASSVSAYSVGASSTASYNEPKPSILQHINKSRERAVKRASKTLNSALGAITQEKLDYSDAKDLSGIAKDMAVIIRNLEPAKEVQESGTKSPQFVIFAPQFRSESSFEVIDAKE